MIGLTKREKDLFDYIEAEMARTGGVCPSFEQMRIALGSKSKSGVHRLMQQLKEKGVIRQQRYKARAVEVVKRRDGWKPMETRPRTCEAFLARGEDSPAIVHVFDAGNGPIAVEDCTPVHGLTEWCEVPA